MVRAVIFDCFGVIITDALQVICNDLRARNPDAASQVADLIAANNRGMITPEESNREIAALLGVSVAEFRDRIHQGEAKDPLVVEFIQNLRPKYKTAMLSNLGVDSLHRRFTQDELDGLFDVVVISGEVGFIKPEPQAYQIAADRLGVQPNECLFTDDRDTFCEAARATGMQAIHYQTFDQFKRELKGKWEITDV